MAKTILITGGAGNIGRKLRDHFAARGDRVIALDVDARGDPAVLTADLATWDDGWVRHFEGVDCVFHLAGDPSPAASWASIQKLNLDLVMNVYEAAARQGAKRLVFASSNWTMAGQRFDDALRTTAREPSPVNAYGVSKLVGERMGRSYAERWGLSVVCFRIGYNQRLEGNPPGVHMGWSRWGQLMWLSDRDMCEAFEAAVEAPPGVRFAVLNLMSANPGMRWDMAPLRDVLGWQPKDGSPAVTGPDTAANEASAQKARELVVATLAFIADRRW